MDCDLDDGATAAESTGCMNDNNFTDIIYIELILYACSLFVGGGGGATTISGCMVSITTKSYNN